MARGLTTAIGAGIGAAGGFGMAGEGMGICVNGANGAGVGIFGVDATFSVPGVISVIVRVGSGDEGREGFGGKFILLPWLTEALGVVFGVGSEPNSTTADLTGNGLTSFFTPIIFSAIVGTRKFGALGIGRRTDSVWSMVGFGTEDDSIFPLGGAEETVGIGGLDVCCGAGAAIIGG